MRRTLVIFILFAVCHHTIAQDADNKTIMCINAETRQDTEINTFYFLLGTLSDYMGRPVFVDKMHQVDYYYFYEKPLVNYLDSLIRSDLETTVTIIFDKGKYETFSEELSARLNSCFHDGLLDSGLFSSDTHVCSFLTGRYYRFGEQMNDTIFKIQVPSSPNNDLIYSLLKRSGCNQLFFRKLNVLPGQFVYYFVPPATLRSCFMLLAGQKNELANEFRSAAGRTIGPDKNIDEMFRIRNDRDLQEAIKYFRENQGKHEL